MKAILEFNLPEDNDQWRIYDNAMNYYSALCELERYIRDETKFAELTKEEYKNMERVKKRFYEVLNDNNIEL